MKFPNTLDINTFKAYINPKTITSGNSKGKLNAIDLDWDLNEPNSLKILCIRAIVDNWSVRPIFEEIEKSEDRNYFLDILSIELPIPELCAHITDDAFWKRAFLNKWKNYYPDVSGRKWIQVFLEKYLSETIENLKPCDYDAESLQQVVEFCSPHAKNLKLNNLQPSIKDNNDHIPFDVILSNLLTLRTIDITFATKTIGTQFYLGCSSITENDIKLFSRGLETCYELREFRLHSTKLEPGMIKALASALDKGCPNLEELSFPHCRCGDVGFLSFMENVTYDSFPHLKRLILTNNFLSIDAAFDLSKIIKHRKIQTLDLRLNPIGPEGAVAICGILNYIPITTLNISCCSIDESIHEILIHNLRYNTTIRNFNVSSNRLGDDLGVRISEIIKHNKIIRHLDLRNTEISDDVKSTIEDLVLENREKIPVGFW